MQTTETKGLTQHTPGPWRIKDDRWHDNGKARLRAISIGDGGDFYRGTVAHMQSAEHINGMTADEVEANARLIASAPELLEALRLFERQWNACGPNSDFGRYFQNVRDAARAAILKATGGA